MLGQLSRGAFVPLAYRLGRGGATGALHLTEGPRARHVVHLRRGYAVAVQVEGHWAPLGQILRDLGAIDEEQLRASLAEMARSGGLGGKALRAAGASPQAIERALERQTELRLERLAAMPQADYRFDGDSLPPGARVGGLPLSLSRWARRHAEAQLGSAAARALAEELAGVRLAVRKHLLPDPADCDDTDRRLIEALASPRRLDEIEAAARAPRYRVLAFVQFLRAVDALEQRGVAARVAPPSGPAEAARRLLGVSGHDDLAAVRRVYRRLARELHPDAHPHAGAERRRELATRFAEVHAAWRTIAQGAEPR